MKRLASLLIFGLVLVLACNKLEPTTVNQITDLYTAPADATAITLSSATSTWSTDRRYFDLNFGSLTTTLVGYDAFLTPGQYVISGALGGDQIGNAINTKLNGQDAGKGFFTVNRQGSKYQITATINDQVYFWSGTLPFTADPDPVVLTKVQQAQSNVAGGNNSLTIQLATDGIASEMDWTTWQTVWTGEGGYLALDIYSDDGYLHEGVYTASAEGGVINAGEFGIGWDPGDIYGIGMEFTDWGTCWWDVKDGAATATKITDGLVTVSSREESVEGKDVTIWTIYWGKNYPKEYVFEGQIPALTKPKASPDFKYIYELGETSGCITNTWQPVEGVVKQPVTIMDAQGEVVVYLEPVLEEGNTELEGSYISTEYAHETGTLANGYSNSGYEGGSYYIADGQKVWIEPGKKVDIVKLVTGAYEFIGEGFDIKASGPDYVPGTYKDEEGGVVTLTKFTNFQSYAQMGMNMVGIEMATDGIVATPGWWGKNYSGDGNYLKLELYAENDVVEPGEYKPNAEAGGALNAFEFNMGYDGAYGASGTAWYTLTADNPSYEYITDGTVTITKDGDNYTVIVKSSTVNVKYVGPLSE